MPVYVEIAGRAYPLRFTLRGALRLLDLTPGSVTPLGLLNDRDHAVRFCLDRDFDGGRIGVHPNDNTATVWLSVRALLALLRDRGTEIELVEI